MHACTPAQTDLWLVAATVLLVAATQTGYGFMIMALRTESTMTVHCTTPCFALVGLVLGLGLVFELSCGARFPYFGQRVCVCGGCGYGCGCGCGCVCVCVLAVGFASR